MYFYLRCVPASGLFWNDMSKWRNLQERIKQTHLLYYNEDNNEI